MSNVIGFLTGKMTKYKRMSRNQLYIFVLSILAISQCKDESISVSESGSALFFTGKINLAFTFLGDTTSVSEAQVFMKDENEHWTEIGMTNQSGTISIEGLKSDSILITHKHFYTTRFTLGNVSEGQSVYLSPILVDFLPFKTGDLWSFNFESSYSFPSQGITKKDIGTVSCEFMDSTAIDDEAVYTKWDLRFVKTYTAVEHRLYQDTTIYGESVVDTLFGTITYDNSSKSIDIDGSLLSTSNYNCDFEDLEMCPLTIEPMSDCPTYTLSGTQFGIPKYLPSFYTECSNKYSFRMNGPGAYNTEIHKDSGIVRWYSSSGGHNASRVSMTRTND